MHEMGIAMEIIKVASSAIPKGMKKVKVKSVAIQIGKLSAVIPETLRLCFDIAAKDTDMSGATLDIQEIPLVTICRNCGQRSQLDSPVFLCDKCGDTNIDIVSGRELNVVSIEIED